MLKTSRAKHRSRTPSKKKPPLVTLTREQCRLIAANFVARTVGGHFQSLGKIPPSIVGEWRSSLATEAAEWRAETGEEMPRSIDDVIVAARLAGWSAEQAEAGDYTLGQVHRQLVATKRLRHHRHQSRELLATDIVKSMAATDPTSLVDRYHRAADRMSTESKKIVRTMLDNNATTCGDKITRARIAEWSGLSDGVVKRRIEGQIRRIEAECGFLMIDTDHAGTWLTPEGVEVARRVNPKILT